MKVLVADDDNGFRMVVKALVQRLGHECLEAANGDEAWAAYRTHLPDVLVTDLMMPPGPDGLQLCRAVRGLPQDSYPYIILLTSLGRHDDVLAGIAAGADDYVVKPLDPFTLQTRLLVAGRVTALHDELARYRTRLAKQAHTDPLTGLNNRLDLAEDLERLHRRSIKFGGCYSLALCDLDLFKAYNDTYGHQAGDRALQAVAEALTGSGRRGEGVYRYGGEEFLLLLPDLLASDAAGALERRRAAVERLQIPHAASPTGVVTMSVGIASFAPGCLSDVAGVLQRADVALYAAKSGGRNRVTTAEPALAGAAHHAAGGG
jgi:two-component system chemotaxis response regulator CheY